MYEFAYHCTQKLLPEKGIKVRIKGLLVVYLTLNEDHVAFNENESYNQ